MPQLVIIRHGQSTFNLENRFTGEMDVPLTALGREEAARAGKLVKQAHIVFDRAFTSVLMRAHQTLEIVLAELGQQALAVEQSKALNERNYGNLQGLNKAEVALQYGEDQVALWRRSFAVRPPGGESLHDTVNRVVPYYAQHIEPLLRLNKNILIVAHGNSLRALMMHVEQLTEETILHTEIATGAPRLYQFDVTMKIEVIKNL